MLVSFGVSEDSVILLNGVRNGELTQSLDLRAWNDFVHPKAALPPLADPGEVLHYACFVYSLASSNYPMNPCDWETHMRIDSLSSGVFDLTLPRAHRSLRVRRDRQVLPLQRP